MSATINTPSPRLPPPPRRRPLPPLPPARGRQPVRGLPRDRAHRRVALPQPQPGARKTYHHQPITKMIIETIIVTVGVCWIVSELIEQRRRETKTWEFKEDEE